MKKRILKTTVRTVLISMLLAAAAGGVACGAERPVVFVQMGHLSAVESAAISTDGRLALSGGDDCTLKLWDVQTGKEIRTFSGHSSVVRAVALSPDGSFAVSGSMDRTLKLWDINTGKELRTFTGHEDMVTSVAFSHDGRFVLSGSHDKTLKLWDVMTGKELRTFAGHAELVMSVTLSHNDRFALSGACDNTLKLWDVSTGEVIRTFSGHSDWVSAVAFSSDGGLALSGGHDKTLKLWDIKTGKEVRTFTGHSGSVDAVAFSPDGRRAFSGSSDKTVKLWDIGTGKEIRTISGHLYAVSSAVISPDGSVLLSGSFDGTVKLWDVRTGKEIRTFTGNSQTLQSVGVSPDGRLALSGSADYTVKLWDIGAGRGIGTFAGHAQIVRSAAFSPDGRYAVSGSDDRSVKIWDIATGRVLKTLEGHSEAVLTVAVSPDSRYVLSGSRDKTARLWEASTGKALKIFQGHSFDVVFVAFSPDGRRALTGSDKTAILRDIATGKETAVFPGTNYVRAAAFSPDGRYLLLGRQRTLAVRDDSVLNLWDTATGRMLRTFPENAYSVDAVAFGPDGRYALSANFGQTMKLWDVAAGKEVKRFQVPSDLITSVAFGPDGRRAFSASGGAVRLWDAGSGNELALLAGFKDGEWIVITPEGYFTASKNGPSRLNVRTGNRVLGLDQFYDVFYRPDIVEAKIKGEDVSSLSSTNLEEALRNPPPSVEFVNVPSETGDRNVAVRYRVVSTGGGIGEIRLFHNGKLVQSDGFYRQAKPSPAAREATLLANNSRAIRDELRGVTLAAKTEDKPGLMESRPKGDVYEGVIAMDAIAGDNDIGLAAFNRNNTVQSILRTATFKSKLKPEEPRLYILSVGIDEYKARGNNLKYAVRDAESIAAKLREQSRTQYKPENIHVAILKNGAATKNNILTRINEISKVVRPNDVFMFFVASHGVLQSGLYSIVTHDYSGSLAGANLINSNEIMEISKNMKALTQIFILDTCHAGGLDNFVSGLYDARMTVMARNMGLHMFASASSTQEAMDGYKGKNGMFTYALLEGLNNNRNADKNNDRRVSIYELGSYAKDETVKHSRETGHTQTPVVNDFGKDVSVYVIR